MPNLRDSGSYTASNPPVADPSIAISATASNSAGGSVITYTTASAHNLVIGQPVITSGFSSAWLNYDPTSGTGNGTPAIVASVTSSTVFTVNTGTITTAASSVSGTVTQGALVSKSPYSKTWLPASAVTNVKIDRAWGRQNPIQPNDDRQTGVAITAASANGTQLSLTVGSGHGVTAGQIVHVQGLVPNSLNVRYTVASTGATNVTVNSLYAGTVSAPSGAAIELTTLTGGNQIQIASATGATATGSVKVLTFTTNQPHGLTSGQIVSVVGSSNANYNVQNEVVTTTGAKTFTVPANPAPILKAVGDGTNVTYTTIDSHGLSAGDKVSTYNFTPSGYNVADATVLSTNLTANTFAVANTATAPVTVLGIAIEQSGSFTAPAYVSVGDNSWGQSYQVQSGNLIPGADNHEINTTSRTGYPAYAPTLSVPNVVGLPISNAIQKIRAAGFKLGGQSYSTDLTATVATTATQVTFTTSANHNLSVGDTVNFSGATTATAYNFGDLVVGVTGSTVTAPTANTIVVQGVFTAATDATLKIRPKNGVVSAQTPAAGTDTVTDDGNTALVVSLTKNYGL